MCPACAFVYLFGRFYLVYVYRISEVLSSWRLGTKVKNQCFRAPKMRFRLSFLTQTSAALTNSSTFASQGTTVSSCLGQVSVSLKAPQATRWLSWYGVGLASADKLPVVVRIPAGPLGSLKCDPPKGNGRRSQKKSVSLKAPRMPTNLLHHSPY